MQYSNVAGQKHIKEHLQKTLEIGRIPHAQLFIGQNGSGILPMAIAYASEILALQHSEDENLKTISQSKVQKLIHPDLHFVYPVNTNQAVSKNPVSSLFLDDWRDFITQNPYGSLFDWFAQLGIENKQGNISVKEADEITKKLSLKSFEGGYKVMIIWMADCMHTATANKILKLIEEPPSKTVLLLLTEDEEQILTTISSRCQKLKFPKLAEQDISNYITKHFSIDATKATHISRQSQGNLTLAIHKLNEDDHDKQFEAWFVSWVRTAFKAKGNKKAINELLAWSDTMSKTGRETQKKFLLYCIELFRQALLLNYNTKDLVYFESDEGSFQLEKFAPFVHHNNIFEIVSALEDANYHIERNGNSKIIFSDVSILLTRYIHQKA